VAQGDWRALVAWHYQRRTHLVCFECLVLIFSGAILSRSVYVTAEDVGTWPFVVVAREGQICGFSAVCEVKGEKMLDHLWVDPPDIGKGLGRLLFLESIRNAKTLALLVSAESSVTVLLSTWLLAFAMTCWILVGWYLLRTLM
jgi:GNAT superfamily N-acetyltransferase